MPGTKELHCFAFIDVVRKCPMGFVLTEDNPPFKPYNPFGTSCEEVLLSEPEKGYLMLLLGGGHTCNGLRAIEAAFAKIGEVVRKVLARIG